MVKIPLYTSKEDFTPDKDCSLLPPEVITGVDTKDPLFHSDYRKWQAAPCIVKTAGGRLFCSYNGDSSPASGESTNDYTVVSVSDDDGCTWRDGELIIAHTCSVRIHEPLLWVDPLNRLWHFWIQSYTYYDGRAGVWAIRCDNPDDETIVWGKPWRLCDGVMACPPMVARNGDWFFPISQWKNLPEAFYLYRNPDLMHSNVYLSRDQGETVTFVGYADEPTSMADEHSLEELADGSFLMIMRTPSSVAMARSFDRGKTWTAAEKLMDGPSAKSFLRRFDSGNLLLVTHDEDFREENGNPCRRNMTAYLSEDGGKTWPYRLLLDERREVSYPSGMIYQGTHAYVAYDREREGAKETLYACFTEEDIRCGTIVEEGSFLRRLIHKAGTTGI